MRLTTSLKDRIDAMTYEDLLAYWREAPIGDTLLLGESGVYCRERMLELNAVDTDVDVLEKDPEP